MRRKFMGMGVILGITAAIGFAGCGDDEEEADSSEPTTLAIEAGGTGKKPTVDAPDSVEAGLVELRATSTRDVPSSVDLIRVDGDQTPAEVLKVIDTRGGKIPSWLHGAGGVESLKPNATATSTQILEPGSYVVVSSAEGDDTGDPATSELQVTGELADDVELPEADATIVADEYSFKATGLTSGKNIIRFDNKGRELHHAIAFPVNGDASKKEIETFFKEEGESEGPPPVDFEAGAGTAVMDGGASQNIEFALKKGRNVLVCFIQNRAGGPPHVALGMIDEVDVK